MATSRPYRALSSFICNACRQRSLPSQRRTLTTTPSPLADLQPPKPQTASTLSRLSDNISPSADPSRVRRTRDPSTPSRISLALDADPSMLTDAFTANLASSPSRSQPHRLHVYATKHNTHLTFVQPPRAAVDTPSSGVQPTGSSSRTTAAQRKVVDVLLSLSAGNIGFRKAGRGSYDAAYQLAAFACKQIQEKGMLKDVRALEVVLRGFGAGRDAVAKVLMGAEGRRLRPKITAVVDATRLKQGGPRGKKPRRLG